MFRYPMFLGGGPTAGQLLKVGSIVVGTGIVTGAGCLVSAVVCEKKLPKLLKREINLKATDI